MYTNVIHVPITIEMNMVIENRDGAEVFFALSVDRLTAFWKIRIHHGFIIPRYIVAIYIH